MPLSSEGLLRRTAPFAAVMVIGFLVTPLPPPGAGHELLLAGVLNLLIAAVVIAAPWGRLPPWTQAAPPLAYLGVVALLREAEGGSTSGVSALVLLPVFWLALYGTSRQLGLALVATAAVFVLPVVLIGGDRYPPTEWERAALWTSGGAIVGFTVQKLVHRISAQAAELADLSNTDALLGLANRRAWDATLARELSRARRDGRDLCVVMLDLDGFKRVNDAHGHQAGDRLLKEVGARWRGVLRDTDLLARYGGDEFGVILPDATVDAAMATFERLRHALPDEQESDAPVDSWVSAMLVSFAS